MAGKLQEKTKGLVLKAFDTLFNQRDYAAAEKSRAARSSRTSAWTIFPWSTPI
jgi:hypothetical protein